MGDHSPPADQIISALRSAAISVLAKPVPLPDSLLAAESGIPALPNYAAPAEDPKAVFTVDLRQVVNAGYDRNEESRPVPIRSKDGGQWRYVRVLEWQNPRRDAPVTSLAVQDGGPSLIVVGITGSR